MEVLQFSMDWLAVSATYSRAGKEIKRSEAQKVASNTVTNLTICFVLEDDSYYSTYDRIAAAVDLGIVNANAYVLPDNIRLQMVYQSSGSSCSHAQYSASRKILQLLNSGVRCDAFLGAGKMHKSFYHTW